MQENKGKVNINYNIVIEDYNNKLKNLVLLAFNADINAENEIYKLLKHTNTKVGIETGTCYGSTTLYLASILDKVYSIEINPESYSIAKYMLDPINNIKLYLGSSEKILERILKENENKDNIFFYLDAHWNTYWPILDELECISKYCQDRAIICIDDFQVPNRNHGFDSYNDQPLNYEYIKEKLDKVYPSGYTYWYNDKVKRRDGFENKGEAGKFYVVPKSINIDWLKQENGINYSNLI